MQLDTIISAEKIITLDGKRPYATKMGVLHGKVVGFDREIDGLSARKYETFSGYTITPGFIDAHCHTVWWGLGLTALQLDSVSSLEELYQLITEKHNALRNQPTGWIHGVGFNEKHCGGRLPDIQVLDEITGDMPVYLRHTSGHAAITNSATLKLAGVFADGFKDPMGGRIVRDNSGYPTGLIEETAQELVQNLLLPYSQVAIANALNAATAEYAKRGITTFVEAGIGGGMIGHSPAELGAYQNAYLQNMLNARACVMPTLDALTPLKAHSSDFYGESAHSLGLGEHFGFGDDMLRFGHLKAFLDGSLLGATAAVTEDYCGHNHNRGYLLDSPNNYRKKLFSAYRAGWPLALHGIGDAAIDLALDIIEECQNEYGFNRAPNRIEHFGISRPDQLKRASKLKIAVTPQAGFIGPLGDQFLKRLDSERAAWLYRGRSIIDADIILAGSSDLPVADNNILRAMQSAVDRKTEGGKLLAPKESITALEALKCYTEWSAKANAISNTRGQLVAGKLADFVVLTADPLTVRDINCIEVKATFMNGLASWRQN